MIISGKDSNKKVHKCGCVLEKNGNTWRISNYCKTHTPNYSKQLEKIEHKENKKRGKGYTK